MRFFIGFQVSIPSSNLSALIKPLFVGTKVSPVTHGFTDVIVSIGNNGLSSFIESSFIMPGSACNVAFNI